jgi:SAM-dependent methyltransferase
VRLVEEDMRLLDLKERFDFIFIPFNTFSLIYELQDRLAVLRVIKKHLKRKGYFVFEIYAPNLSNLAKKSRRKVVTRKEFWDKAQGIKLVRTRTARYHPASQVINNRYDFKKYQLKDEKLIEKYSTTFKLYKFFPSELRLLLESNGFLIKHFWGDYQRNEFGNDSKKMIVVAKKAKVRRV